MWEDGAGVADPPISFLAQRKRSYSLVATGSSGTTRFNITVAAIEASDVPEHLRRSFHGKGVGRRHILLELSNEADRRRNALPAPRTVWERLLEDDG